MRAKINHPWVDESAAPLYAVTYPPRATDDEIHAHCAAFAAWWPRVAESIAFVIDARQVVHVSAAQRRIFADAERVAAPYVRLRHRGAAFIIPHPLVRGFVTAIYWVAPPVYEYTTAGTMEAARAWTAMRLATAR